MTRHRSLNHTSTTTMPDKAQYSPDTFKILLKKLVQTPTDFTPEDCASAFRHLVTQAASEAQVSAPTLCTLRIITP
jgi:hypothetical protein